MARTADHRSLSLLSRSSLLAMLLVVSAALCISIAGCKKAPQSSTTTPANAAVSSYGFPVIPMEIAGQSFSMEIANTPDRRKQGLMDRQELPLGQGMIFTFTDEAVRDFWMHNVPFDLDLVFLDKAGVVVRIVRLNAMDESTRSSDFPAAFALELPAGTVRKLGLTVGTSVKIPTSQLPATE